MIPVRTRSLSIATMGAALVLACCVLASCATQPTGPAAGAQQAVPPRPQAEAPSAPRPRGPTGQHAPLTAPSAPGAVPHVALLLPLTGRQAAAAATIRDGFLTAYYVSPTADRPRLRLYDTGSTSVAEAVSAAMRAGARFIVGPLTRDEVAAAAQLPAPRPPILALNFLPTGSESPPAFYQFALSPEAEAREVARRVLADGHTLGIALAPEGDWGSRVLAAFREALTAGGGTLLAAARYEPQLTSYAPAISAVLGIDESNERYKRVRSIVGGRLGFEPRRRADIQFIFAPASAASARLLTPQLRYFFAGNLPTYATSEAFEPNPTANEDLDGLEFPDMPWMLGSGLADSVRLAASAAWPVGGPSRSRLFAFGFDAYRLLRALHPAPGAPPPDAGSISVEGLTGHLTLDATGHVQRALEWARMRDGQPRLLPVQSQPLAQPQGQPQPGGQLPPSSSPAQTPAAVPAASSAPAVQAASSVPATAR